MEHAPAHASLRILTPAKVNLGLWVTGRRGDGYHTLVSLFLRVPLWDYLEILPAETPPDWVLESTPPLPPDNTLYRTWRVWGEAPPLRVRLVKGIPSGAGLGGGSANAAGLLWGLNHLAGYSRTLQDLTRMGERVGADVPFFLWRVSLALVQGIGEKLLPLPWTWPETWRLYLLLPPCSLSTASMYAALSPARWIPEAEARQRVRRFLEDLHREDPAAFDALENVFFPLSKRFCPVIESLHRRLQERGARWISLTGTGSGVLAFFDRPVNLRAEELDIPDLNLYLIGPPPIHPLLPRGVPPSLPGVFSL